MNKIMFKITFIFTVFFCLLKRCNFGPTRYLFLSVGNKVQDVLECSGGDNLYRVFQNSTGKKTTSFLAPNLVRMPLGLLTLLIEHFNHHFSQRTCGFIFTIQIWNTLYNNMMFVRFKFINTVTCRLLYGQRTECKHAINNK